MLELATHDRLRAVDLQSRLEPCQPPAAMRTGHGGVHRLKVEQAQIVRLAQDPGETTGSEHVGQVDSCARHCGDRYAADRGHVIAVEAARSVDADARRSCAGAASGGHMNLPGMRVHQSPRCSGILVTHHRAGPGRPDGGQEPTVSPWVRNPDRENPAVQAMEPTARCATVDRAAADAEPDELRVRDDAVLARCEARQRHVGLWAVSTLVCGVKTAHTRASFGAKVFAPRLRS